MTKKKIIQILTVSLLMLFSFFYTNKSIELIRETDPLMKKIKATTEKYKVDAVDAKIIGNKIIPGKTGKEIDYQKSYTKMIQYGSYNEVLTTFKEVTPAISIDDYYDKYIVQGNSENKAVSLVFKTNTTNLQDIVNILNSKNIPGTFFIDGLLLENNTSFFETMTNHELELLSYDNKYDQIYFESAINYLNSLTKTSPKYCYAEYDQKEVIELCSSLKMHTIIPTIKTTKELPSIIDYITQKGYSFETLSTLLSESAEK